MSKPPDQLVWINTTDLRVADNTALHYAALAGSVIAVFILTPEQFKQHDDAPIKQDFWYRNLLTLSDELGKLNIPLKIIQCPTFAQVPDELFKFAVQHTIKALHFNQRYEFNERACQASVSRRFELNDIAVHSYTDSVIFEPGQLKTQKNDFYTVFTPFKNLFNKRFSEHAWQVLAKPKKQKALDIASDEVGSWIKPSASRTDLWPAGEALAKKRLNEFINNRVQQYKATRDIPSINGTSTLSPYLASGIISIRQCFEMIEQLGENRFTEGVQTWRNELIWREFYKHILIGFPRVSKHIPFKEKTNKIKWNESEPHFQAWCDGKTGIPIVDAAMRQLVQTGWMHNRLRMVTAMFLSKNLFLDWRRGEQFFMRHLIDGDLSANNGGWQWSASTGTDAAPYFRIFNPLTQSQRFDPEGKFIKKFIPELKACDAKTIHDPWNSKTRPENLDYPKPIVDLKSSRQMAIERFKALG